jgi:hypothetical protein
MGNLTERRQPLSDITEGRRAALKRSMACEEEDFDIPVVSPAEISLLGEKKVIPFSVSQMQVMGEMRSVKDHFANLVQTLSAREGTVVDVTSDILAYHDHASLTEARQGLPQIESYHVGAAVRGDADWPTVIRVECWLRDSIQAEQGSRNRMAAIRLWCLCVASFAGPESVRKVVEATIDWGTYSLKDAQCSGGGSDMVATVAWKRAMLYADWMWTVVMLHVDRSSEEALWDWRRVDKACYTHAGARCPGTMMGKMSAPDIPSSERVPGGYSGNMPSLADVLDDDDESSDEEDGQDLIDFEAHENSMK